MKYNVLFYIQMLLLMANISYSQSDLSPEDDESIREDSLTHLDSIPYFSYCHLRNLAVIEGVIIYQNYAKVGFRFIENPEDASSPILYRIRTSENGYGSSVLIPIFGSPGQTSIIEIPLDVECQLLAINSCEDTVELSTFSTRHEYPDVISTSKFIFESVMNWTEDSGGIDLYDLIAGLSGVSNMEKVYFLQQFMRSDPLPSNISDALPPKSAFMSSGGMPNNDCRCRTMGISASRLIAPIDGVGVDSNGNLLPIYGHIEYPFPNDKGRVRMDYSIVGPSRWQNLDGRTSRCRNSSEGREWNGSSRGDSLRTIYPFMASLRFGQACVDGEWMPSVCTCQQEIRLQWRYDSYIEAHARTQSGRACFNGGRNAYAVVDDAVLVTVARRRANNFNSNALLRIVGAARGTVVSNCHRYFDETKIVSALLLAYHVYSYIKGFPVHIGDPTLDGVVRAAWEQYNKNEIVEYLKDISKEWVIKRGVCSPRNDQINLYGYRTEHLNGNDEFEVILSAFTYMEVMGITHWISTSRLISGYSLSGVLLQKTANEESPYCCTRSYASYSYKTMFLNPGIDPVSYPPIVYRNDVGSNLNTVGANFYGVLPFNTSFGVFEVPNELGEVHGRPIVNCGTLINGREKERVENSNNLVVMRGRSLWLVDNDSDKSDFLFKIMDVKGRLIAAGRGQGYDYLLHTFDNSSTGIYFVNVVKSNSSRTFKFFVP